MSNIWPRNRFETKLSDQDDDVTNQFHLLKGIPRASFNLMPHQEIEKIDGTDFFLSILTTGED